MRRYGLTTELVQHDEEVELMSSLCLEIVKTTTRADPRNHTKFHEISRQIHPGPMKIEELVERDPEKMSGTPVFPGTRVPINHLFDCLEGGETLDSFLDQFPTVSRDQALAVLSASRASLLIKTTNTDARLELMSKAINDELFLTDLNAPWKIWAC